MSNSSFDNGIPELTEVIPVTPVPASSPVAAPSATARVPPAATPASASTPAHAAAKPANHSEATRQPPLVSSLTDEEWRRLEADIRERISLQLLGRVDYVLEQRVRDSLADVLQTAVEGLSEQIKLGLHDTLKDVIARAVSQEITRMKTTKN